MTKTTQLNIGIAFGLLAMAIFAGCVPAQNDSVGQNAAEDSSPASLINSDAVVTEEQRAQLMAAKDQLFTKLSGRLMDVLTSEGPVKAIDVCHAEAPALAQQVSQELGLRIGRTGVRLRNPANAAPEWATELVAARHSEPWFGVLKDGRPLGLLPIKLRAQCVMCHGAKDQIGPDVLEQLRTHYPDDAAIGFREGELRGWFWVEGNL